MEDSGTESDDETEKDDVEDAEAEEEEDGDISEWREEEIFLVKQLNIFYFADLDSGVSLNLRSSGQGSGRGGRTKQLPSLSRGQPPAEAGLGQGVTGGQGVTIDPDTDNHSSEEELEDIIGVGKKVYSGQQLQQGRVSIKSGGGAASTNPEKRKWSEVTCSSGEETEPVSCHQPAAVSAVFRAGSGSSGDEEVSGLMESSAPGGSSDTPVQFCTSPPLDVYKPRKSQSPPPKLFHMSAGSCAGAGAGPAVHRQHSLDCGRGATGSGRPSGAFLPRPRPRLLRPAEYLGAGAGQCELGGGAGAEHWDSLDPGPELELDMEPGHRSPNKRHRSTPKPQNIQRPCLDFEKMQQVEHNIYNTRHILTISVFRLRLKLSPLGGKEQNFPYSAGKGNSEKTVSAPQYIPVLLSPANIYQCRTQLHFKRSEPQELKLFSEF